jgi:hypothetical protein
LGFGVWGLGFGVDGLLFRGQGVGLMDQGLGSGFGVVGCGWWGVGVGFRLQAVGCRGWGALERLRENLADFEEKYFSEFVQESFRWTVYRSRPGTNFSMSEKKSPRNRPSFPASALSSVQCPGIRV